MTKKYLFTIFFFSALFVLLFSVSANASTSDALDAFYYNNGVGMGSGYSAPNVSDSNDFVDVSRGDVIINETDYVIKGRNGMEIPLIRSYNPDRWPGFIWESEHKSKFDIPYRIAYYYINTTTNDRILIGFKTEFEAYEYKDGIIGVNHETKNMIDDYNEYYYNIGTIEDEDGDYYYERDFGAEPVIINKKSYYEEELQSLCYGEEYINLGSGWTLSKPGIMYWDFTIFNDVYYTYWGIFHDIYGNFINIEFEYKENSDGTIEPQIERYLESHRDLTVNFVDSDNYAVTATHSEGFEYNFTIESGDGLKYYFYCEDIDNYTLKGISDKYNNTFTCDIPDNQRQYYTWTDCSTDVVYTIDANGITMTSGEETTSLVSYEHLEINSDADVDNEYWCDNTYKFTVYNNDTASADASESDNYVTYNMSKRLLREDLFGSKCDADDIKKDMMMEARYIDSIEYSNGLSKHYTYTMKERSVDAYWKYLVSQSYEIYNEAAYNKNEYTYSATLAPETGNNPTGGCKINTAKMKNYKSDSLLMQYTDYVFDEYGRTTSKTSYENNKRYLTEEYTYGCTCYDSPVKKCTVTKKGEIVTTNTYDDCHKLTKVVYGDTISQYEYGAYNNIVQSTQTKDDSTIVKTINTLTEDGKSIAESAVYENDVLKSKTTFTYNSDGTVASQSVYRTNEENVTTDYSYQYGQDGSTTVTQTVSGVTDADNANETNISTQTTIDIFGNITKTKDANGNETLFEYDLLLRPTKTINADGTINTIEYDDVSNQTIATDARNNSFRYKFDPWGNCTEYAYKDNDVFIPVETAGYDYSHRLNRYRRYHTDSEYYESVYTYDNRNRVLTETVKDNSGAIVSVATYTYTDTQASDDTPLSVTTMQMSDANNTFAKTEITTDYLDRTVSKKLIDTDGNARTFSYTHDYFGNVLTSTAPDNSTETYTYDHAGNVLSYTNQLGNTMTYAYDMSGLNTSVTDFMNNTTNYTYDKLGRLIKTVSPFTDTTTTTSKTYYDANGNVIKEASQKDSSSYYNVNYTYDNMNRVKTVNDGSGYLTQYFYDVNGNVICMANGLSNAVNSIDSIPATAGHVLYTYDSLNRCISKGGTETGSMSVPVGYSYDRAGNVIGKHLSTGDISYTFDAFGNIKSTSGASSVSENYAYNALGQRTSMTDETGTTTYTYDDFGNLTTETKGDIVKTSTYDVMGNRTGFTVTKNGTAILTNTYTYDSTGKMISVTSNGQTVNYAYDANGNLLTETGSGHNVTNTYNKANLPVTKVNKKNGTVINNYSMLYDLSGNKIQMTDSIGYYFRSFTYDSMGRLWIESIANDLGMGSEGDSEYQYDNFGNRLIEIKTSPLNPAGTVSEYTYGDYNQLTRIESRIGYEPEDEQRDIVTYAYDNNGNLSGRIKTNSSNETLETNTYTFNNAGRMTQSTNNGVTTTYTYNGDGLRMSKTTNGVTTSFILDAADVVAEIKGDEITIYSRGLGLISKTKGTITKTYFSDSHGDITGLYSSATNGEEAIYDGFGNTIFNDSSDNPFGYCGEYYDEETGFIYLRARYYDPEIGRFISEDPAMDGTNWYVYCSNNPVMFVDPWGLDSYIFYLPDWEDEAQADKQELINMGVAKNEIHLIPIVSKDDLETGWNDMGITVDDEGNEQKVSIDYVIINTHANPECLSGSDEYGNWWHFYSNDISSLDNKNITKTVLVYGCNAGHLDYKYTNPASSFAKKVDGALVHASDGTVSMKDLDGFYNSNNDSEFRFWRNNANQSSVRNNEGWVAYRYNGIYVTTRVVDSGTKKLMVEAACQIVNY